MANAVEASELAGAVETSLSEEVSHVESEDTQIATVADSMVETGDLKDICKNEQGDKEIVEEGVAGVEEKGEETGSIGTEVAENQSSKEIEKIDEKEKDDVEEKEENDEKTVEKVDIKQINNDDEKVVDEDGEGEEDKDNEKPIEKNDESSEKDENKVVATESVKDEGEQKVEELEEKAIEKHEGERKEKNDLVTEEKEKVIDDIIKSEKHVEEVSKTSPDSSAREVHEEVEGEDDAELDDDDEEEDEDDEERGGEDENVEGKSEKPLDDDQDRRNPQYIPKGGAFYEHDNRTSLEDVENKDPQETDKKKKSWKVSKESERWLHDCYNESEQLPKSTAEIIEAYGYDIRNEDAPPRARRRRKYGRGPDKYERSWEDEQAYLVKQNNIGRRGKKKPFGKEEFPPLPNQKPNSPVSKPVQKSSPRRKEEEQPEKTRNVKINGNDRSPTTSHSARPNHSGNHSGNHSNLPGFHSNKKNFNHVNRKINDDDIKPFRNDGNKWKNNFKQGKQDDFPRPIRTQAIRQTDPPFRRSVEVNRTAVKESDVSHITDEMNQMSFHVRMPNVRDIRAKTSNGPDESKVHESEMDSPANRQNPKRYSKIRKGFTGIFPPEEVPELGQSELHKLQQEQQKSQHMSLTQPLNMQNVMKRYAGTYDFVPGNTSYLGARPVISGISQQAMSPQGMHQQTLSPQGIPQQALSPQVTGLQTIELQQNPLAQPNFVPHANFVHQSMYIGMDAHYPSDVVSPYSDYPPYSGNQTGDVYQPASGITYYSRECQSSGQKLPPPPPRQKTPIPIVPPGKH